ncbi:conserved hypothetical protein [Trichinella spiralis]|uniref:hypothetical protein n=1 Tax=Trichinella spiralis TaxID=6334 RepID=UPI0001EFBF09|nr:conserved hypothetical protein [Trichinella spiralis]
MWQFDYAFRLHHRMGDLCKSVLVQVDVQNCSVMFYGVAYYKGCKISFCVGHEDYSVHNPMVDKSDSELKKTANGTLIADGEKRSVRVYGNSGKYRRYQGRIQVIKTADVELCPKPSEPNEKSQVMKHWESSHACRLCLVGTRYNLLPLTSIPTIHFLTIRGFT